MRERKVRISPGEIEKPGRKSEARKSKPGVGKVRISPGEVKKPGREKEEK
ncbi:MAG: hypothetical protein ACLR6I_15715 [Waltera sp.]